MSYFQNPFDQEFRQAWILDDRQFSPNFVVPANKNRADLMVSWNEEPYDFSTYINLTIYFAFDTQFKNWAELTIDVSGDTVSATTAAEVRDALNANTTFAEYFLASVINAKDGGTAAGGPNRVVIKARKSRTNFRFYVSNGGAETKLKFNKHAGVADVPLYLERHTIANRFNYTDSQNHLIRLTHTITGNTVANPTVVTSASHGLTTGDVIYVVNSNSTPTIDGERTVTVTGANTFTIPVNVTTAGTKGEWMSAIEKAVVADYGLTYSDMKEDWELLAGRSQAFTFQKNTVDGNNRVTQSIVYSAGARAGDLAKKITYTYTSTNTSYDTKAEVPYILTASDLLTP